MADATTSFPVGAHVEYFSASIKHWIPAVVLDFSKDAGTYRLDIKSAAPSKSVRAPEQEVPCLASGNATDSPPIPFAVGQTVQVWSVSKNSWVDAQIESLEGDTVRITYPVGSGKVARKAMPAGHKHLRRVVQDVQKPVAEQPAAPIDAAASGEGLSRAEASAPPPEAAKANPEEPEDQADTEEPDDNALDLLLQAAGPIGGLEPKANKSDDVNPLDALLQADAAANSSFWGQPPQATPLESPAIKPAENMDDMSALDVLLLPNTATVAPKARERSEPKKDRRRSRSRSRSRKKDRRDRRSRSRKRSRSRSRKRKRSRSRKKDKKDRRGRTESQDRDAGKATMAQPVVVLDEPETMAKPVHAAAPPATFAMAPAVEPAALAQLPAVEQAANVDADADAPWLRMSRRKRGAAPPASAAPPSAWPVPAPAPPPAAQSVSDVLRQHGLAPPPPQLPTKAPPGVPPMAFGAPGPLPGMSPPTANGPLPGLGQPASGLPAGLDPAVAAILQGSQMPHAPAMPSFQAPNPWNSASLGLPFPGAAASSPLGMPSFKAPAPAAAPGQQLPPWKKAGPPSFPAPPGITSQQAPWKKASAPAAPATAAPMGPLPGLGQFGVGGLPGMPPMMQPMNLGQLPGVTPMPPLYPFGQTGQGGSQMLAMQQQMAAMYAMQQGAFGKAAPLQR